MMSHDYKNPTPTVDIVIIIGGRVLLIKRASPPHGWAIPGGFVDEGEPLAKAAVREALEETSLSLQNLEQFHTYSDPARDPRKHTISTVYIAKSTGKPIAGDDARDVRLFSWEELPEELVFDHKLILKDVKRYLETGERPKHIS